MILTHDEQTAFKQEVLKQYPKEAAALVIGGKVFPCANTAEDPLKNFKIDGKQRLALELEHGAIQAVLHSHPYKLADSKQFISERRNPAWASVPDQKAFIEDDIDWGIVATDGEGVSDYVWLTKAAQPLERREFCWFQADCYAAVRDWYRINRNFTLPNFTREWQFWRQGINTIEENLLLLAKDFPYEKLPTEKAQVGDAAVFAMGGYGIVNHVAVISGNNEIIHQFAPGDNQPKSYAHVTQWNKWAGHAKYVIRFKGLEQ